MSQSQRRQMSTCVWKGVPVICMQLSSRKIAIPAKVDFPLHFSFCQLLHAGEEVSLTPLILQIAAEERKQFMPMRQYVESSGGLFPFLPVMD